MRFDYFYGNQPEQYQFYKLPKLLVKDETLKNVSMEAKVLYSLMLDRAALSKENEWLDEEGRVYIYFTNDEICRTLDCANQKATKLLNELSSCGLIIRKRSGLNRPSKIYVMNFATVLWNSHNRIHENHDSGDVKIMIPESWKSHSNKTDDNKTEGNKTDLILSDGMRCDQPIRIYRDSLTEKEQYLRYFTDQLMVSSLCEKYPYEADRIQEIVELLADVCSAEDAFLFVGQNRRSGAVVRSRLMKLTSAHIEYVLHCMDESCADVRNIRQYLLTALYNAPVTMKNYYQARVNHDMAADAVKKEGDEDRT